MNQIRERIIGGQNLFVKNCRISEKRIWKRFEARDRDMKIENPKDDRSVLESTRSRLPFGTTVRWRDMAASPTSVTCFAEGVFGFPGGCGRLTNIIMVANLKLRNDPVFNFGIN